ncbi:hypothetical protein EAE96_001054 [Botrytis aclada]|nr:hypothetical protein EAE96_001054 [Botrytis aclada]
MIKLIKLNKKSTKTLPNNPTIHDEGSATLHRMTLNEQWEFKKVIDQEKITLSTNLNVQGKSKPKNQFQTPMSKYNITKLPHEVLLRISSNLDFHGNQNLVPLALTCRSFYLLFSNNIKRVNLCDPTCRCTKNNLPRYDMDNDHMPSCRPRPLWSCLEDWTGFEGYRYVSGRHNFCCPRESKLKNGSYRLSPNGAYVPWPIETRAQTTLRIKNQEEAARSLCHALSVGVFIKVSAYYELKAEFSRCRGKTNHYVVPTSKTILCVLDRQARHCWGKDMMLDYAEWRDMIGF